MTAAAALARLALSSPPPLTRDLAREQARHELSKGIYHRDDPPLLLRAVLAVVRWLQHVSDAVSGHAPGGWAGVVGLVALAVLVVVALRWRAGPLARRAGRPAFAAGETPRTAAEHRAAADRHAAVGEWRAAVRERLRAVLRELEDRGVLDPRPGRTATEAAEEAGRALPGLAGDLHAAARAFEDVWYGEHPASAATDATLRTVDEAVRRSHAPQAR